MIFRKHSNISQECWINLLSKIILVELRMHQEMTQQYELLE